MARTPTAKTRRTLKPHTKSRRCSSVNAAGFPCKQYADRNNADGLCVFHQKTEDERRILQQQAQIVRRQAKLKPHELMRQVIESNPVAFMQPYLDALGIRIVFVPDPNDPQILHPTAVVDPQSNGSTLFGVSKDGHVIVSRHKDIEAQQRAAERLFDRVYGKPKQTNILHTGANNDDPSIVPFDDKRQAEVAAILQAAQRPSHSANGPTPTTPTTELQPPNSNN